MKGNFITNHFCLLQTTNLLGENVLSLYYSFKWLIYSFDGLFCLVTFFFLCSSEIIIISSLFSIYFKTQWGVRNTWDDCEGHVKIFWSFCFNQLLWLMLGIITLKDPIFASAEILIQTFQIILQNICFLFCFFKMQSQWTLFITHCVTEHQPGLITRILFFIK